MCVRVQVCVGVWVVCEGVCVGKGGGGLRVRVRVGVCEGVVVCEGGGVR